MPPHVMARPVLDRGGSADRLRNHLRRRAITRLGLIEGDLYLLPFWRATGQGPEGEKTFHLLAADLGDDRLMRANLPPSDLKPFDDSAVPPEARLVDASLDPEEVFRRAEAIGWSADSLEELIHYPFWLMRVEDSGRFEGAWIDGVEGKVIHHTLKVPPPAPSFKSSAMLLAAPALLLAIMALAIDRFILLAAGSLVVAMVFAVALLALLENDARKERKG